MRSRKQSMIRKRIQAHQLRPSPQQDRHPGIWLRYQRWESVSNEEAKRMEKFIGGATLMPYHVSSKLVYCQALLKKIATSPLRECLYDRKCHDKRSFYILYFNVS